MHNIFSFNRFKKLFIQQVTQNKRLMLFGMIGYCGVIFIILLIAQLDNLTNRLNVDAFIPMLVSTGAAFGVLYTGYAFPFLRTKEKSFSYLTIPASTFEKFLLEFCLRILATIIILPCLFWSTFNLGGNLIGLFLGVEFTIVSISDIQSTFENGSPEMWVKALITMITFIVLLIPFTGAAIFKKQPLIKTLFSLASIIMFFVALTYIIFVPLGLENYDINESVLLTPLDKNDSLIVFTCFLTLSNIVMLVVAYLKLKEREV